MLLQEWSLSLTSHIRSDGHPEACADVCPEPGWDRTLLATSHACLAWDREQLHTCHVLPLSVLTSLSKVLPGGVLF